MITLKLQSPLYRPSARQAGIDTMWRDATQARPVHRRSPTPAKGNPVISRRVGGLDSARSPSAVRPPSISSALPAFPAGIVAIVVAAVKGILRPRLWSDILQESRKALFPPFTHRNPSPTIPMKEPLRFPRRTTFHASPCAIFRGQGNRGSMFFNCLMMPFFSEAPTTFRIPRLQAIGLDCQKSSALTQANPFRSALLQWQGLFHDYQPSERLTWGNNETDHDTPPYGVLESARQPCKEQGLRKTVAIRPLAAKQY